MIEVVVVVIVGFVVGLIVDHHTAVDHDPGADPARDGDHDPEVDLAPDDDHDPDVDLAYDGDHSHDCDHHDDYDGDHDQDDLCRKILSPEPKVKLC